MSDSEQIALLERALARQKASRIQAETLLEQKSRDLFEANKKLEALAEQLRYRVEEDAAVLALKANMESLLLRQGQLFIQQELSCQHLHQSMERLAKSLQLSACLLVLEEPLGPYAGYYQSGHIPLHWPSPPPSLSQDLWQPERSLFWLPLYFDEQQVGCLCARIDGPPDWIKTIRLQLSLFRDMVNGALSRQLTLQNAQQAKLRAEASERSTREFLAMINHELRSPLNGLLGAAELLYDTTLTSHQTKLLSTCRQAGELLRSVINDLLDYSKMNAGMMELVARSFSIHQMLDSVKAMFQLRADEKQLELSLCSHDPMPEMLIGDSDRILQIMVNLVGNALKFTEQGRVQVDCYWKDGLTFQVKDTGAGIALSEQHKLFQPFQQVDSSTTRQHEGTGLGLAICHQLSQLMGGQITLQSELGLGACFTVHLPLQAACSTGSLDVHQGRLDDTETSFAERHILVVEDLTTNQLIIDMMLKKINVPHAIASNGVQALEKLDAESFDLVLMDCRMPVMDGYEATRQLRQKGMMLPVLALTAGTTKEERQACFDAGMDDILTKPYQLEELKRMLCHYLGSPAKR
ncbi:Sensor histidine kinase RcsC [Vibrio stylophorae]|uniref:histidine kinase n=1 Tax=Vibrio stylophorae TaxID=659351 RepID=A0ABM8ZWR8_9VIBR|nr:ATP-binding protein [Vibrio stylophorae]CAH0535084.1 Sensor histidine kinase RcsC [Vibrio stylophorae]